MCVQHSTPLQVNPSGTKGYTGLTSGKNNRRTLLYKLYVASLKEKKVAVTGCYGNGN